MDTENYTLDELRAAKDLIIDDYILLGVGVNELRDYKVVLETFITQVVLTHLKKNKVHKLLEEA